LTPTNHPVDVVAELIAGLTAGVNVSVIQNDCCVDVGIGVQ
jgi:hypothetical protein